MKSTLQKDDIKKGLIYCDDDGKPLFDWNCWRI